jgi:hypothetical protein
MDVQGMLMDKSEVATIKLMIDAVNIMMLFP